MRPARRPSSIRHSRFRSGLSPRACFPQRRFRSQRGLCLCAAWGKDSPPRWLPPDLRSCLLQYLPQCARLPRRRCWPRTLTGATAAANPMPANPLGRCREEPVGQLLDARDVQDPRNFNKTAVPPNFGPDHVQGWSFGIQRQLGSHAVVESRYVGNHAGGLFQSLNANPYVAGSGRFLPQSGSFRRNALLGGQCRGSQCHRTRELQSGNCDQVGNTAVSDYNGWQNELRANNLWNQLTLRTSFTWSKTTDNTSEIFSTFAGRQQFLGYAQNPFDTLHGEHALSGLDIPAQWTLSFVEMLPFYRGQHGLVGRVLGGWSLSGSYIISSGQPYTPIQYDLNYLRVAASMTPPSTWQTLGLMRPLARSC